MDLNERGVVITVMGGRSRPPTHPLGGTLGVEGERLPFHRSVRLAHPAGGNAAGTKPGCLRACFAEDLISVLPCPAVSEVSQNLSWMVDNGEDHDPVAFGVEATDEVGGCRWIEVAIGGDENLHHCSLRDALIEGREVDIGHRCIVTAVAAIDLARSVVQSIEIESGISSGVVDCQGSALNDGVVRR